MHTSPIWDISLDGYATSVPWVDVRTNTRFAIWTLGSPNLADDLIFDKETGLTWTRSAGVLGGSKAWLDAMTSARAVTLGNRMGWRLPSVEELSSLIDSRFSNPALPAGHPFTNIQTADSYWTRTDYDPNVAWGCNFGMPGVVPIGKGLLKFAWAVRSEH
jgi:hypothetical protein